MSATTTTAQDMRVRTHCSPAWLAAPWTAVGDASQSPSELATAVNNAFDQDGADVFVYFPVPLEGTAGEPPRDWDLVATIERTRGACAQAVRCMRARQFGRLMFVAPSLPTLAPEWPPGWEFASWLAGLTRGLALELAAHGVTVNTVLVGMDGGLPWSPDAADELRHAIQLFIDRDANYLTGQVMHVCGGRSMVSIFSH